MTFTHKHKGIVKSHSVAVIHKDPQVMKWHNEEVKNSKVVKMPVKKTPISTTKVKPTFTYDVKTDDAGYIVVNLDEMPVKGIKVSFTRTEGIKRREVNLKIDKL